MKAPTSRPKWKYRVKGGSSRVVVSGIGIVTRRPIPVKSIGRHPKPRSSEKLSSK